MYIPLSDDKHQMVRDSSKKCTGQRGCNSNPVAMLPHAAVVFHMQPFNFLHVVVAAPELVVAACGKDEVLKGCVPYSIILTKVLQICQNGINVSFLSLFKLEF